MKTKQSIPQRIVALIKGNPIVVMMAIISLIVGFTIDNFFSFENLNVLLGNTTIRFMIALGVSGCLITKGTDLSAGRQAALAATLTGVMVQRADYASRLFSWMPVCMIRSWTPRQEATLPMLSCGSVRISPPLSQRGFCWFCCCSQCSPP